jgi:hypothetical protein
MGIPENFSGSGISMRQSAHPIIIDVEASGFGPHSYPIEVGVALEAGRKYCSLIAPEPEWTHWDEAAEKIHRVPRDVLEAHGKPALEVAHSLNALLCEKTVYSDGWGVDQPWLIKLFSAARVRQQFRVSPLEMILSEDQMAVWHATKDIVMTELALARHRASIDATIIQETYCRTCVALLAA